MRCFRVMGSTNEQRDAHLVAQIEQGETILGVGPQALVTDRRILFAWRLAWAPHPGRWTHDSLVFDEIIRWTEGRQHDDRPLLRLEHPSHGRLEWMSAHRFLWFRWGNSVAEISHQETTFSFASRRDPAFQATKGRLEWMSAPRFLWFRWGNSVAEISHQETTFSFTSRRDPAFQAMKERLELASAPQGASFVEMLSGTREERLGRSMAVYGV